MTRVFDEASYRATLWQRLQLESERQRLIEGIKRLPTAEREHFAPWIEFLEQEPDQYPRLKRDMERIGFDLRALMAPIVQGSVEVEPVAAREVVVRLSPLPANDSSIQAQYRQAANFSTSGQVEVERPWHGKGAFAGDMFKITARPDPLKKRVQITIGFDEPKSLAAGSTLFVTLPGPDESGVPVSVELRVAGRRLQGALSVAMAWSDFVAHAASRVQISYEAPSGVGGA
jgi:hypothetical protein